MEIINFFTDYLIPIIAIILSISFYLSAKKNAEKSEELLKLISNAVNTWQNDIMKFASSLLNSTPSIVGQKAIIAKIEAANELKPKIEAIISNLNKDEQTEEQKESIRKDLKLILDYQYHFLNSALGAPINIQKPDITDNQRGNKK